MSVSDTYDGITAAGCFCAGHIPCASLHEVIRIVKPGEYVPNIFIEPFAIFPNKIAIIVQYTTMTTMLFRSTETADSALRSHAYFNQVFIPSFYINSTTTHLFGHIHHVQFYLQDYVIVALVSYMQSCDF